MSSDDITQSEQRLADYQDDKTIRSILLSARSIAIVGLSPNALRPSNFVGFYLQRHGYRIVPVNPREKEILVCLARGESNKSIARTLCVAESTVKIHVQGILRKLNLVSRVQAAVYAVEKGLMPAPGRTA